VRRIGYDLQRRTAFQPLVATPEEWRQRIEMGDPFFLEIARKGKVLYEERYPFLPSQVPYDDIVNFVASG
jgi:hypothetical protein